MKQIILLILLILPINIYAKANIHELITHNNLNCAEDALKLLENYRISEALNVSNFCQDPAIQKMILWLSLYDNYVVEAEPTIKFIYQNRDFPAQKQLNKIMERNLNDKISDQDILYFYSDYFPQNYEGFTLFVNATKNNIKHTYHTDIINNLNREYFLTKNFPAEKFNEFISAKIINNSTILEKINNLLTAKEIDSAKKLLKYIKINEQKLFKARIALIENNRKSLKIVKSLPKNLRSNSDLSFDVVSFLERKDADAKISTYILNLKPNLNQAEKWLNKRLRNARYLINKGDYKTAYKIVAQHYIKNTNLAYVELEWFSGWIALRYLDNPELALKHFHNMYNNVKYAISLSRGAYWLGRAYAQKNQPELAQKWYQEASNYSTSYYGQMAMLELKEEIMINLPKFSLIEPKLLKEFIANEEKARISLYFAYLNKFKEAELYLTNLIMNNNSDDDIKLIISLANYSNNQEIINKIARHATRYNIITLENYPLITNLPTEYDPNKYALIMSIIKQESGFSTNAVSKAGALGFMQLMPETAKYSARKLQLPFNQKKLQTDANYNIKLGSYYLTSLLKQFSDSYILAIAAYNAGPTNTQRWIKDNGDPRKDENIYQIIDWIEKITFAETRNYVQRILENSVIYLHLMKQKYQKFPLPKIKPSI